MRVIHTSDWHLGRQFGPVSLRNDQEAFADWFVTLVGDQQADLVVIAGDLYDRAIAPVDAIDLFRDTIGRLLATGVVVAAISGNHDGADRVAPYSDLLDLSRFYLRGGYDRAGEVITHRFEDGPLDLVLVPFLDPQAAPDDFGVEHAEGSAPSDQPDAAPNDQPDDQSLDRPGSEISALIERRRRRTHASVLGEATTAARSRLVSPRSLAIAHAFVTGAEQSDSERQLVVGGAGDVPRSVFDGFSYTALGHLHRPQQVGGETLRYSGTPLAYSFSEEHAKSVVVVDIDPVGECQISQVPVDGGRKVATITGEISELLDGRYAKAKDCFVRAIITDREVVLDAKAKLAFEFPYIVEVQLRPGGREFLMNEAAVDVSDLPPIDATRQFWEAAQGTAPNDELDALLVDATSRAVARGEQ